VLFQRIFICPHPSPPPLEGLEFHGGGGIGTCRINKFKEMHKAFKIGISKGVEGS